MGLFDFARGVGKKLFNNEGDAPEKLKAHIEEDNPGVQDLSVSVKDGVASLTGTASTPEAAEKAILMAGNIEGIEKVDIASLEAPTNKAKVEYYEIKSGDTLSGIAKKYYQNAGLYTKIFEANKEVIKNPDLIFVGQKIRIPLEEAELA